MILIDNIFSVKIWAFLFFIGLVGNTSHPVEICDNGIDDDGDGLIDCYDPECTCSGACEEQYYRLCPLECTQEFSRDTISLQLEWESVDTVWNEYSLPVTGDVDGDGKPEIVGKRGPFRFNLIDSGFVVYNAQNGATKYRIDTTPLINYTNSAIAIADLDRNGNAEMLLLSSASARDNLGGHIFCYELNGGVIQLKWVSDSSVTTKKQALGTSGTIAIADMDHDGAPEIIVSHFIFDGLNGRLKAKGDSSMNRGAVHDWVSFHDIYYPVIADILPDTFCSGCEGLELAAGNVIYSVRFDSSIPLDMRIREEVRLPGGTDGLTASCDFDRDGDLDIIYTHAGFTDSTIAITVWDGQRPVRLTNDNRIKRSKPFDARFTALPVLCDIDGDGYPEILENSPLLYRVLDWENGAWKTLLSLPTSDKSGMTGSTVFDFNHDGKYEIVYRDETELQILDALTGRVWYKTPCLSGTFIEYPVIADVDQDGEAEIVCGCGEKLRVYGTAGTPWPKTRSVWNQSAFYNVQINDDMTVPVHQQAHHIVGDSVILNNYIIPYAFEQLPAVDLWIDTLIFECSDSLNRVTVRVCNAGEKPVHPNTPVSVYNAHPLRRNARNLLTAVVARRIEVDSCIDFTLNIPDNRLDTLYFVVNAPRSLQAPFSLDSFPFTEFVECDYFNNFDSVIRPRSARGPDLGPDIHVCSPDSILLSSRGNYTEYLWQDGSTDRIFVVDTAGMYWVQVKDICGQYFRDTILVDIIPPPMIDIGGDTMVCQGGQLVFSADSFDYYSWQSNAVLDCDSCASVHLTVDTASWLKLVAETKDGCVNRDSIFIDVYPVQLSRDSIPLCSGDTIVLRDTLISRPGTYRIHLTGAYGCDSVHEIFVWLKDGYLKDTQFYICPGDSALIFGHWQTRAGTYQQRFETQDHCDSIILIDLLIAKPLIADIDYEAPCPGDSTSWVQARVRGGLGPVTLFWDGLPSTQYRMSVRIGQHVIRVLDSLGCSEEIMYEIVPLKAPDYRIVSHNETCPGEVDGSIEIIYNATESVQIKNEMDSIIADYNGLKEGYYFIQIKDSAHCLWYDTVFIEAAQPVTLSTSGDTSIYKGDTVQIWARSQPPGTMYSWSPARTLSCEYCRTPLAFPQVSTKYTVHYMDALGCELTASLAITVIDDKKVYIPNVFTPNNDGYNEGFTIYGSPRVEEVAYLAVYDRWGELLFEKSHFPVNVPAEGWDGRFRGVDMQSGVYVYRVIVVFKSGKQRSYTGDVTLLR